MPVNKVKIRRKSGKPNSISGILLGGWPVIQYCQAIGVLLNLRAVLPAEAILDRFLHYAEVIRLQVRSYRMHNRRELQSKKAEEALTVKTE